MKNLFKFFMLMTALLLLSACGGGSSKSKKDTTNPQTTKQETSQQVSKTALRDNQIIIIDGYIKQAIVKDSIGQTATYTKNGVYTFPKKPVGTIHVYGGEFENSDITNKFDYHVDANYQIISPLTHYISNYPKKKDSFLKALKLSDEDVNADFYQNLKADKSNKQMQKVAKVAQILYALEVNDLLKKLDNFQDYKGLVKQASNLSSDYPNSLELIEKTDNMSTDELLKAEQNIAVIKNNLNQTSIKESGIRLVGEWKFIGKTTQCGDKSTKGKVIISYDENTGYKFTNIASQNLQVDICLVTDISMYDEIFRERISYYRNVKYPLPISEFTNAIELSKLLTDLVTQEELNAKALGVKLVSPDKFINEEDLHENGKATIIYTRVK